MNGIKIFSKAEGGFKIIFGYVTEHFSTLNYAITNQQVQIIPPAGSAVGSYPMLPISSISVNLKEFTTADDLTAALEALYIGKTDSFGKPAQPATGSIIINSDPDEGDTVTINDGADDIEFEFSGTKAAGAVAFTVDTTPTNPDNGDILIFDEDGDYEKIFEFNSGAKYKSTIAFTDGTVAKNIADGTILNFRKGITNTQFIFLLEAEGDSGYREVAIGANPNATMAAFVIAFNTANLGYTATAADTPDNTCTIEAATVGSANNASITSNSIWIDVEVTQVGYNNGQNISDEGNIGIPIGASANATMVSFISTWNKQISIINAFPASPANNTCTLKAVEIGVDYNLTLTSDSDKITITAPTGGTDADEDKVAVGATIFQTASNLATAINFEVEENAFNVAALANSNIVTLCNLTNGPDGNEDITKDCDTITITGMSGGRNKVDINDLIAALTPAE